MTVNLSPTYLPWTVPHTTGLPASSMCTIYHNMGYYCEILVFSEGKLIAFG